LGTSNENIIFVVAGDIKTSKKAVASNEVILGSLDSQEVQILSERATMLRYTYIAYLICLCGFQTQPLKLGKNTNSEFFLERSPSVEI